MRLLNIFFFRISSSPTEPIVLASTWDRGHPKNPRIRAISKNAQRRRSKSINDVNKPKMYSTPNATVSVPNIRTKTSNIAIAQQPAVGEKPIKNGIIKRFFHNLCKGKNDSEI